ncbi:DUF2933 domain-containing protein [Deinococcus antarcticus]|uniref:DUF2933 domain-containing protein n=1 Tax=Deinococcus antarcticus TaxID=1298767 RepID=A0ABV8AAT7_9DEIO
MFTRLSMPARFVLVAVLIIAAAYLLAQHTAHVFGALPLVFVLLCPLMHLFMHGGHGGHGGTGNRS